MTDPCIDAEVLAAWNDGALDRRAAADVERHAAQCARCQAMLAAFVRTEPAQAPAPARDPVMVSWWQSLQVRWLVPIAAAATAVAIWTAIPGSPRPEGEGARAPEASVAAPPAQAPTAPVAATEPLVAPTGENRRETAPARKEVPAESAIARQEAAPDQALQRERANTQADADRRLAEAASPAARADDQNRSPAALRSALADAAVTTFASRDGAVRWRLADPSVERSTDGGSTWVAAVLGSAQEQDQRAVAPRAGAAAAPGAPASAAAVSAAAAPAAAIVDARPAVVAGDAPTALVCWLVGPRGAVWITADGGQRFSRVTVTGEPDLRSVTARDARSADVTTADGRTLRTSDGGSTWTLTSP